MLEIVFYNSLHQNMKIQKQNVCQRLNIEESRENKTETPHKNEMVHNIFVVIRCTNSDQNKLRNRGTDSHAYPLRYIT